MPTTCARRLSTQPRQLICASFVTALTRALSLSLRLAASHRPCHPYLLARALCFRGLSSQGCGLSSRGCGLSSRGCGLSSQRWADKALWHQLVQCYGLSQSPR
eukprot:5536525-Pleurochrysis_carterae.AAC.1